MFMMFLRHGVVDGYAWFEFFDHIGFDFALCPVVDFKCQSGGCYFRHRCTFLSDGAFGSIFVESGVIGSNGLLGKLALEEGGI